MENSAYVPTSGHINAPALVVFSQAAGGLQDSMRIQRPFNPQFQMAEAAKELHRPITGANFGLRHHTDIYGLPMHMLNPRFLHPCLSLGSGAFRPLADLKSFPSPSAFAPPKCLKIETNGETGHGIFSPTEERYLGPSPRTDSCSPASASMSPQLPSHLGSVKEESTDAHMSEDGDVVHGSATDNDSPGIHDDNRGFRIGPMIGSGFGSGPYAFSVPGLPPAAHAINKTSLFFDHGTRARLSYRPMEMPINKKKKDPSTCPICGIGISPGDLEAHFMHELERLYKVSGSASMERKRRIQPGRPVLPGDSGPEGRWETFQRIKTNRQGRLRLKNRKRKADDCPICVSHMHKSSEEMCLRKGFCNDEDEPVDVEGDSELEEWAELQKRRTIALTRFSGITPSSSGRISNEADIESEDLIVDGDEPEESCFGPSQYTESDVVSMHVGNKLKDKEAAQSQVATVNSSGDVDQKRESCGQQCDSNVSTSDAEPSSRVQIIEELRSRIRQLEAEGSGETATSTVATDDYKCLICLEHYKKPVISTVCWHVHCEECWLHTLGSKKVCPQCSMITSPADLRRIFM